MLADYASARTAEPPPLSPRSLGETTSSLADQIITTSPLSEGLVAEVSAAAAQMVSAGALLADGGSGSAGRRVGGSEGRRVDPPTRSTRPALPDPPDPCSRPWRSGSLRSPRACSRLRRRRSGAGRRGRHRGGGRRAGCSGADAWARHEGRGARAHHLRLRTSERRGESPIRPLPGRCRRDLRKWATATMVITHRSSPASELRRQVRRSMISSEEMRA